MSSLRFPIVKCKLLFTFFIVFFYFSSHTTLYSQCEVNAGSDQTICEGESVTLGGTPTLNNPPGNVTYNWTASSGAVPANTANPSVSPSVTTTYTLDIDGAQDCNGNNNGVDQITVTVIPAAYSVTASANSSSSPITICAGSSLDLSSSVAGVPAGQNGNVVYSWSGPNGYTSSTGNPTPFNASANAGGSYTVTASIGDCDVNDNVTVNVISASINNTLNGQNILVYCLQAGETSGEVGFLIDLPSSLGSVSYYQVNWDDGSPVQQVSGTTSPSWSDLLLHTYGVGAYSVQLTVYLTNGCTHTTSATAFVGSSPSLANLALFANQSAGCAPLTTQFTFNVPNTNVEGTTYTVNWGDGSLEEVYTHPNTPAVLTHVYQNSSCGATNIFNVPNAYSATITTQNPCSSPQQSGSSAIVVGEQPTSDFNLSAQTVCVGELVNTLNNSDAGVTFSTTSTSCQTTAPGCWTIASPAGANPAISSGTLGNCSSANFAFWTPGSTNIGATFNQAGSYTYSYRIKNSCGEDIETETLCVINPPICAFTLTPTSGCSVLNVSSSNTSQPPSCNAVPLDLQYTWTVSTPSGGNGSSTISSPTAQNPTFSFTNTGTTNITFTVTLTVAPINPQTGLPMTCTTTCTQTVTVSAGSQIADAGGPYFICGNSPVTLGALSNGSGQWTGGSGTFADATNTNAVYTPALSEVGTTVNLTWTTTDQDGAGPCIPATDQASVTISTPANFTPLTPLTICSSSAASLQVTTTPATGSWSGGGGTFDNANSSTTVYTPGGIDAGNANLNLVWTTTDPDGAGPCSSITVNQPLDVIGTATAEAAGPYSVCGAAAITLSASANGAGQWTGGAGTFANATLVNTTYTPTSNEIGTSVTLTWTTNDPDGAGPCIPATDQASLVVEECTSEIFGCMDVLACNYNPDATVSDESCIFPIEPYLDCLGQCLNDTDSDGVCDEIEIGGCTSPTACNYNSEATDDDGSCILFTEGIITGEITPDAFSLSSYTYTPTYISSTIEWVVNNGVVTSGQGTAEIQIQWAQEGMGSVQVQEIYSADCVGPAVQIDVVVIPTLIDELSDVSISVFPNPTSDILNIKSETNLAGSNWTLLDITGREVLSGVCLSDYERVDLKFCAPGQYILRITQPGIVKNFPVIYSGRTSE